MYNEYVDKLAKKARKLNKEIDTLTLADANTDKIYINSKKIRRKYQISGINAERRTSTIIARL